MIQKYGKKALEGQDIDRLHSVDDRGEHPNDEAVLTEQGTTKAQNRSQYALYFWIDFNRSVIKLGYARGLWQAINNYKRNYGLEPASIERWRIGNSREVAAALEIELHDHLIRLGCTRAFIRGRGTGAEEKLSISRELFQIPTGVDPTEFATALYHVIDNRVRLLTMPDFSLPP